MQMIEEDLQALREARRVSAAKVRSLLQALEDAEKEFNALTEQVKMVAGRAPARDDRVAALTQAQQGFSRTGPAGV